MIIFSTPFTGKTPNSDNQTQDWYKKRVDLFIEYTLGSLKNQTDKDFLIWLQFRPQEKTNLTTERIRVALKKSGLQYVMTFNGPIMMEDKATWHNKDLIERAEKSLKKLPKIKDDWVVVVGLDSDDMVYSKFVEYLKTRETKERGAFYMTKGFIYSTDGRLADWVNPESMSIYAITYPTSTFLDATEQFKYQDGFNSHEQIPKKFNAEHLPDGMFCALYHGGNISTVWNHPFRGKEYFFSEEVIKIMSYFK